MAMLVFGFGHEALISVRNYISMSFEYSSFTPFTILRRITSINFTIPRLVIIVID